MTDKYKQSFSELISAIIERLPKAASDELIAFTRIYYSRTPLMELREMDPAHAAEVATNSFAFFAEKTPVKDRPVMRLLTPEGKTPEGKESGTHLILEILNNDMPFLVDSLRAELGRLGITIHETIHPVMYVQRSADGALKKICIPAEDGSLPKSAKAESFIHFELSFLPDDLSEDAFLETLKKVLHMVKLSVDDWHKLTTKTKEIVKQIWKIEKYFERDEVKELYDFISWLLEDNFVFLGYIEYDFTNGKKQPSLSVVPNSELGLFRLEDYELKPKGLMSLPPELLHFSQQPELIEITKSNRKSSVHRPVLMDYISIKRFDTRGKVIGEHRFLGMFTSTVYYQSADQIPYIRLKIARTLVRANFDPNSHNGKSLKAILEFYPRDELFQISENDLLNFSIAIMALEAKPNVKLLVRKDRYERFMSCMVYVPRERFNTYLREQITQILESAFGGSVTAFYTQITDSPLARAHLIVSTEPGQAKEVDLEKIEAQIARVTNRWQDGLRSALQTQVDAEKSDALFSRYCDAFSDAYLQVHDAKSTVADILKIEGALKETGLAIDLYQLNSDPDTVFHVKIYTYHDSERALSDMLPLLEHMGCVVLEVNPFEVEAKQHDSTVLIRDFLVRIDGVDNVDIEEIEEKFETALTRAWMGHIANDDFNSLTLFAGLTWREVRVIRSFCQYLRQIGFPYSRSYMAGALAKHPEATKILMQMFFDKFDPADDAPKDPSITKQHMADLRAYLEQVGNMAEDKIIRRLGDLIEACLRTNYFQTDKDGNHKPYLSFKFNSSRIPELPAPVPYAEIFVYSIKTEGIHLRGGNIARGGLRWSDRPEDFRTEVLGLVKAQMVKNAVIVPQGAKGCFIAKDLPDRSDRDAFIKAGIESYKEFLCGLLDVTDNLVDDKVIPPDDVVRYDDDDPYLVVAADKGTATFSDIANSIAEEYGFWLGDAFASGGSVGYDHKAMGITARGAWVSVMRHFAEMGKNIDEEDFTAVGIGDMSGDVFGNGMLLSEHIRLVGAFNHLHIFIDPNPDAAKSFKERKRLFELPRSSWIDYDKKLISKGGGVFSRQDKSIPLSKEIQALLDTKTKELPPDEVIKLLLKAEVELLWNGGIGTYVKAGDESHDDVGDRANNSVRINGSDLRCKIVGEGGNLGFTQKGRIEYARTGGRINTDAIDNSAGVDCSDHEVNIKIALDKAVQNKRLTVAKRNKLLEAMTNNVAELVLIDNRLQTQALTIAEYQGMDIFESNARMMRALENNGMLDREVEFLPDEKKLNEMRAVKQTFTRAELCVLLSYAKLALYEDIKDAELLNSDYFIHDLVRYFPDAMQGDFKEEILAHPLRRDIIGTIITNSMINRAGITFAHNIKEETGIHPCDIARAYVITRDAFKLRDLWCQIEILDGKIPADIQAEMFFEISSFIERSCLWFLQNCALPLDIPKIMNIYAEGISVFAEHFESLISETLNRAYTKHVECLKERHVPESLARSVAGLEAMSSACDIVMVADEHDLDVRVVGNLYFELGARLRLGWLRRCAANILSDTYWNRMAVKSVISDLYLQQRRLTSNVIESLCRNNVCSTSVDEWYAQNERELERYHGFINDMKSQEALDFSMLIVAMRNAETICSV